MKIDFNIEAMKESLQILNQVVPTRTPKAVLRMLHFETVDKKLVITGTNLEETVFVEIDKVKIKKPGTALINADKFSQIVKETKSATMSLETDDIHSKISSEDSLFTLFGAEVSSFPVIETKKKKLLLTTELEKFQAAINKVIFATAKESVRYAITGCFLEVNKKKALLTATDCRRLAQCSFKLSKLTEKPERSLIIPKEALKIIIKLNSKTYPSISISLYDNRIMFESGGVKLISILVEGQFPDYKTIINKYKNSINLPTEKLISAVRRAALLVTEESKTVKLSLTKDKAFFRGNTPELGNSNIEFPIDYSGTDFEIGFNAYYLIDMMKTTDAALVNFEFETADKPFIIKTKSGQLYLQMPIAII